jgi:hypothetical protein
MNKLLVTAVTVSVAFSDKEYGKGTEFFQNISAKAPDSGIPLEDLSNVIDQSFDLYFACWKALLTDRFIAGIIKGDEYKTILTAGEARLDKIRRYLKTHDPQSTEG